VKLHFRHWPSTLYQHRPGFLTVGVRWRWRPGRSRQCVHSARCSTLVGRAVSGSALSLSLSLLRPLLAAGRLVAVGLSQRWPSQNNPNCSTNPRRKAAAPRGHHCRRRSRGSLRMRSTHSGGRGLSPSPYKSVRYSVAASSLGGSASAGARNRGPSAFTPKQQQQPAGEVDTGAAGGTGRCLSQFVPCECYASSGILDCFGCC
jgi:hypothetical protein